MKNLSPLLLTILTFALAACTTRSISDSGFDAGGGRYGRSPTALYQGELNEFDVLGIDRGARPTEEEIARALATRQPVTIKRGTSVMLIQSGAMMPDDPMLKALDKHYTVTPFTGVPAEKSKGDSAESYSRSLRLAAARSGCEKILVYWGTLESARENLATTAVSWVPVVGWVLPDERQRMRIRLKVVAIDVRTGQWETFLPDPLDDRAFSSIVNRRETDQSLVGVLKEKAYVAAAEDVKRHFGR